MKQEANNKRGYHGYTLYRRYYLAYYHLYLTHRRAAEIQNLKSHTSNVTLSSFAFAGAAIGGAIVVIESHYRAHEGERARERQGTFALIRPDE